MEHPFDGPPTCGRDGTIWTGSHCLHAVGHNDVRCRGACGGVFTDPTRKLAAVPDGFVYRLGFWHTQPGPLWAAVRGEMLAANTPAAVKP